MRLVVVHGLTLRPPARRFRFLLWWVFGPIVGAEVIMELDSCWPLLRSSWLVLYYLRQSLSYNLVVHVLVVNWLYFSFLVGPFLARWSDWSHGGLTTTMTSAERHPFLPLFVAPGGTPTSPSGTRKSPAMLPRPMHEGSALFPHSGMILQDVGV
jgi:hypothetical protein